MRVGLLQEGDLRGTTTFDRYHQLIDEVALADQLGGAALTDLIVEHTHTCYHGVRGERHGWGYGCGECPACALRKAGHAKWRAGVA